MTDDLEELECPDCAGTGEVCEACGKPERDCGCDEYKPSTCICCDGDGLIYEDNS